MATFANQSKNSSTMANQAHGAASRIWNEATETLDEASGTWDDPFAPFTNSSKNSSTMANQAKN